MKPKSLMTQYIEGTLASRELQDMMVDYAANARFDRDMDADNFNFENTAQDQLEKENV